MEYLTTKTCSRCRETYSVALFDRDKTKPDGLYPRCKPCRSGWASVLRPTIRRGCRNCGRLFRPRHTQRGYVTCCSRECATDLGLFRGPHNGGWQGNDIGYSAAHVRLRVRRGLASDHRCVDCDLPARHWSINRHRAPLASPEGHPYSPDAADYDPRCASCHKYYDLNVA